MRSIRRAGIVLGLIIISAIFAGCLNTQTTPTNIQTTPTGECWGFKKDVDCPKKATATTVKSENVTATPMPTITSPTPLETIAVKGSIFTKSQLDNKAAIIYNNSAITMKFDPYPWIKIKSNDGKNKRVTITIADQNNPKNVWTRTIFLEGSYYDFVKLNEVAPPYEKFQVPPPQIVYPSATPKK